jgi:hypothetical protein
LAYSSIKSKEYIELKRDKMLKETKLLDFEIVKELEKEYTINHDFIFGFQISDYDKDVLKGFRTWKKYGVIKI